jgi:muconolactone delta-isomerase
MSNSYIINIALTKAFDPELASLVPAERQRVQELAAAGLVKAGYMRSDLSGAYLIMQAGSEAEVRAALESLPMYRFMTCEIVPCQPMDLGPR